MNRSQKASPIQVSGPSSSPQTQAAVVPDNQAESENAIRRRAYELYEERGRGNGRSEEDWLRAEAELAGTPSAPEVKQI